MNVEKGTEPVQLKEIPSTLRSRPQPANSELADELRKAKKTWYYWWYRSLMLSDEYRQCCKNNGKGRLNNLYVDFGNVFQTTFDSWWLKTGRYLFAERKPIPTVNVYKHDRDLGDIKSLRGKLLIEVPLDVRKSTVVRKINKILKEAYEGREVLPRVQSTARRKLAVTKLHKETVERILTIHTLRASHPNLKLWQLGVRAGVDLDLMARTTDEAKMTEQQERQRMAIAVSRYLKQARNLITNATEGVFPSIKAIGER